MYEDFHHFRVQVVPKLLEYKLIQLPQSTFFSNPAKIKLSQDAFKSHSDFTLLARDQMSFNFMQNNFSSNQVILVPDIVFILGYIPQLRKDPSVKILHFRRKDYEAPKISQGETPILEHLIDFSNITSKTGKTSYLSRDWGEDNTAVHSLPRESRSVYRAMDGLDIISSGEVVIVDRLHGILHFFIYSNLCI